MRLSCWTSWFAGVAVALLYAGTPLFAQDRAPAAPAAEAPAGQNIGTPADVPAASVPAGPPASLPAADSPEPAPPAPPFSQAEARSIDVVRTCRASNDMAGLVTAARGYLNQYPNGHFADEALLALGDGLSATHLTADAAQAYQKLLDGFPGSAMRDEARVALLPLLQDQGKGDDAEALAQEIAESPSLQRNQARLWQAKRAYEQKDFARAAHVLTAVLPGDDLSTAQQTEATRLLGMSYWRENRHDLGKHWMLQYLDRDDAPERKAEAAMLLAADAESAGHTQEALGFYQQVVDRYPVQAVLPQALYRRAELYAADLANDGQGEVAQVRQRQAIGYYAAYLETNDPQHRGEAMRARARLLATAGRNEEALQDYERLAALGEPYRNDVDLLRERVAVLKALHREDDAAALLDTAVRSGTLPAQVRLTLVMDQAELQYSRKNCTVVETLLQPMPPFSDRDLRRRALFMRGFCRYQRGQWEGASVDLEGFINDPDYESLVVPTLLDAYEKSAQYPRLVRTVDDLTDAHRLPPTEGLLLQLGRAYAHLGEPQKIIDVYARLEQMNPQALRTAAIQLALAVAYESQSLIEESVTHYKAALALAAGPPPAPEYWTALERMQPLYLRQQHHAELVALDQKAAEQAKDPAQHKRLAVWQAQAELAWGQFLLTQRKREEGISHLGKARDLTTPSDGDARVDVIVALAQAYSAKGNAEQATRLVKAELAASKSPAQKARLISALVATSSDWGTRMAKDGDLDGAIQYYTQALKQMGKSQPQERYALAMKLDPLYGAKGNYAARSQLAAQLFQDPAFETLKPDLAVYRSEVLKAWGRNEAEHGRYKSALEKYSQAMASLPSKEWKRRYEVAGAVGQIATPQKDYAQIVAAYEKVLPDISDPAVAAQVHQYLGRVDMEWAAQARSKPDLKTARTRYAHALEQLPPDPASDRVLALQGLSEVLVASGKSEDAVQLLASESRKMPASEARQSTELLVGTVYRDALKDAKQARAWLTKADTGTTSTPSLEAAMALVDLDQSQGDAQAAAQRLEAIAKRNLDTSPWYVPVHYKLAVLYHGEQKLTDALNEYTLVSNVTSRDARTRYAKVIAEAKDQSRAIGDYMKLTGGAAGSRIAVPKLKDSQ